MKPTPRRLARRLLQARALGSRAALLAALSLAAAVTVALDERSAGAECAEDAARKIFEAGKSYYDTGYYDDALRSFKRAYDLCPKPAMLLNTGATQERLGNLKAAIDAYEQYTRDAPEAEDREATLARIKNLKRRMESPSGITSAPAGSSAAPAASGQPPPAPSGGAAVVPGETTDPQAGRQGGSRLPAYISFGVAGAAAIGAVATGLVANGRYSEAESSCSPRCTSDDLKGIKSMALVSTVLTGVAVAGAGVGAVLFFLGQQDSSPQSGAARSPGQAGLLSPRWRGLSGGLGPQAGKLEASWTF